MGLLDLPATLFGWIDGRLSGVLPPIARIALGGVGGAVLSMALYRVLSPQGRIRRAKADLAATRRSFDAHDGTLAEAWPTIAAMLRASLRQLALVAGPTLIASLPLLSLVVWLDTAYGLAAPPSWPQVPVEATPASFAARWADGAPSAVATPPRIVLSDGSGHAAGEVALAAPAATVQKRQWWNLLIGNPAGYLPEQGAVDRIDLTLPRREYIAIGPAWLRGWEAIMFAGALAASLAMKAAFRIA